MRYYRPITPYGTPLCVCIAVNVILHFSLSDFHRISSAHAIFVLVIFRPSDVCEGLLFCSCAFRQPTSNLLDGSAALCQKHIRGLGLE